MATGNRMLHDKILKIQRASPPRLETIGNCVANVELNLNLLSTSIAEAGKEGVTLPPELLFILNRFGSQIELLKVACVSGD